MTRTAILALSTAAILTLMPAAFAQVDASTTVGAAVNVDANGDGNVSAEEQAAADAAAQASGGASGEASASASLTVDATGDGSISAEEIAAANAIISASGNASIVLDANGDGTVSLEEAAAAEAAIAAMSGSEDTLACDAGGLAGLTGSMKMAEPGALSAATNVKIVLISNCAADEVSSALASEGATNIRKSLEAHAAAVAAIQARGATMADVLGATSDGNTATVYVVTSASSN